MDHLFDRTAAQFDRVGPPIFRHFGKRLVAHASLQPGMRVLDVGTGRGAVLFPAADQVGPTGRVFGIDNSTEMVRETTQELDQHPTLRHVRVFEMDAEELRFPDMQFDRVLCGLSLFLTSDPSAALGEMRRVLRPEGRLGISVVARESNHFGWLMHVLREAGLLPHDDQSPGSEVVSADTIPGMQAMLQGEQLSKVTVLEEDRTFVYRNEADLWESLWSHGARRFLERTDAESLQVLRANAQPALKQMHGAEGIVPPALQVIFGTATR